MVYVSDLQDILFFFFGILALHQIINSALHPKGVIITSLLLLASLLSKESGALFFAISGLYILLFKIKDIWKYTLAAFTALGIYSILRFAIAGIYLNKHGLSPITTMPLEGRVLSIPKIIFSYLKTFVYPDNLAINQHWAVKSITWSEFTMPLIVVSIFFLFLFAVASYAWKKKSEYFQAYFFFLGWFIIGLGLHLQIFPLDLTYSDRWFYFPIVGLLGTIGIVIKNLNVKNSFQIKNFKLNFFSVSIFIIIILALSTRTFIRNFNWKDGLTLYSHDIKIARDSFDLENNLGVELFRAGRFDEAEIHFKKSTELAPNWWTNWNNLGVIYERKGDYQSAKKYYQKAIDNGKYYLAYENIAKLLFFYEDINLARDFTQNSLKILPNNANLWLVLSLSEYKLGNKEKALEAAKNAYFLSPNEKTYYLYSQLSQNLPIEVNQK